MQVRALALALPLLLGIACRTSSTQSSSNAGKTAAREGDTAQPQQTATSNPNDVASGQRAEAGTGTDAGNTSAPQADATSSGAIDKDKSSGAMSSSDNARDPLMVQDHQPIKAHASDHVISGKVTQAGRRSLSVQDDAGDTKTLIIVPETAITQDGADIQSSQLHEGQQVNASYNDLAGDDVAVVIDIVAVPVPDTGASSPDTGSSGSTGATDSSGSKRSGGQ